MPRILVGNSFTTRKINSKYIICWFGNRKSVSIAGKAAVSHNYEAKNGTLLMSTYGGSVLSEKKNGVWQQVLIRTTRTDLRGTTMMMRQECTIWRAVIISRRFAGLSVRIVMLQQVRGFWGIMCTVIVVIIRSMQWIQMESCLKILRMQWRH